jgi:hypothetical protein
MNSWVDYFPPLNLWNWPSFFIGDIMHPLVSNLSELSNEELHKKYNELTQKMNQAHRFGPTSVIPQMQMILENYRYEMDTRNRKLMEEMEAKNDKFKDLIDIKK